MDLLLLVCLCLLTWSGTTFGERVTATEGSDVILPCFLNESLVPMVIIWEKEENLMKKLVFKYNNRQHSNNGLTGQDEEFKGRVFHFPDKLRDGNASIRISNTKITDSGNYRCNIPDRKLFRIELVVDSDLKDRRNEKIPGAAPEPIIEILDETKNGVKVMCVVGRASPQPDVQWQDSAGNNLTAEKQKVTGNGDIILTATVTKTDTYTCVATQKSIYHQIQSKMLVTVTGKSVVNVSEDSVVILPCSLNNENLEQKEFVWKKDDHTTGKTVVFHYNNGQHSHSQLIGQDNNGRVLHFKDELENGNASIKIKSTKISDSGNYTCTIQGKQESFITLSVDLILKDRTAKNPGAAREPHVTILNETNDWSLLQCKVRGASLQPDVQWQDSDGNTLTAEEPQVTTDGERYDVIVNVTVTNSDYYYCVATQKNIYHQVRSKTHVTVPGFKDWAAENLPGLKDPSDLFLKDRRAEISGAAPKPYVTNLGETKDGQLLQCEVQRASPQPDVQWQDSDGNNVTAEEPQVTTDGERYDVIVNVKVTRTDTYRCVVTQKEYDHQTNSTIYVHIPGFEYRTAENPGAAREPYVTILHQTNDWAKLRCKVPETLPQPHVQWRDSAGKTLTESQGSGEIILDVTVTKTDYYSCVATQDDALSHQTQSGIYVYIHDLFLKDRRAENPGAAPRPYVTNLDQTNDWSLLQCEVRGASPQPDVQWQDSDGNTLTAEEPQVTIDGERYDVIINVKVTRTDTYRCVVTQKEIGHQIKSGIYVHINGSVRPVGLIIVVALLVVAVAVLLLLVLRAKGYRFNKENQTPQNNEFKMVNTHET